VNLQDARCNNEDNMTDVFPIRNGLKQGDALLPFFLTLLGVCH